MRQRRRSSPKKDFVIQKFCFAIIICPFAKCLEFRSFDNLSEVLNTSVITLRLLLVNVQNITRTVRLEKHHNLSILREGWGYWGAVESLL